mgnify:CR=1 FL=1
MNIGFQTSGLSGFTRVAYLWRRHASAVLWIAMAALLPTPGHPKNLHIIR